MTAAHLECCISFPFIYAIMGSCDLHQVLQGSTTSESTGSWSVSLYSALTAMRDPASSKWYMNHTLQGLQPATDYEVTVAVENKFGWSARSELFRFYTIKGKSDCY